MTKPEKTSKIASGKLEMKPIFRGMTYITVLPHTKQPVCSSTMFSCCWCGIFSVEGISQQESYKN